MDFLFNNYIPETEGRKIILRPTSKTFINGLACSYDTSYHPMLKESISEKEYSYAINRVIDDLSMMWPCCFCFTYGYMFCVCTLGLSFLFPNCCVSEAKERLLITIQEVNESTFNRKNLSLSYHQKCSTSWLQIDFLTKELDDKEAILKPDNKIPANQIHLIRNQL